MISDNNNNKKLEENLYNKECLECGQIYIGHGNSWYGVCPECKKGEINEQSK